MTPEQRAILLRNYRRLESDARRAAAKEAALAERWAEKAAELEAAE